MLSLKTVTFLGVLCRTFALITLKFKRDYREKLSRENIEESLFYNYISSEFKIGNPKQKIRLNLVNNEYSTIIFGSNLNWKVNMSRFNEKTSTSFVPIDKERFEIRNSDYCFEGIRANETFTYLNNKHLESFSFVLTETLRPSSPETINYGVLGLYVNFKEKETEGLNFIKQLKKNDLIEGYTFTFKYEGEDEGSLIIGDYPHNYDKKNYKQNEIIKTKGIALSQVDWALNFTVIKYGNVTVSEKGSISFLYTIKGVVIGSYDYYTNVTKDFFQKYLDEGICSRKKVKNQYQTYSCEKNNKLKINQLKDLIFYHKEMNYTFVLTYKDLFTEFEGRLYFLVYCTDFDFSYQPWIIGKPFLKKYQFFFNQDSKEVGFYSKVSIDTPFVFNWYVFWIVILSLVAFGLISVIVCMIRAKLASRKKRAIELVEDYEYVESK